MTTKAFKENHAKIDWNYKKIEVETRISAPVKASHLPMPMIVGDYAPYECPVTGKIVDGRAEHKANLEKHGCRILEAGEFEDVKQNGQKRLHQKIDNIVDKAVDEIAPTLDI